MALTINSFASMGLNAAKGADTNNDGVLHSEEFNSLPDSEKRKIQRYLKKEGKWEEFKEQRHIAYEKKIRAQRSVTKRTSQEHRSLRESSDVTSYTRTLKKGMKGSDVKSMQIALNNAGYNVGTPDGKFGPNTDTALRNYQRKELGQTGDGVMELGGATMASFSQNSERSVSKNIETASKKDIKALQRLIGTPDDGQFGEKSHEAMVAFVEGASKAQIIELQRLIGTTADGDFGNNSAIAYSKFTGYGRNAHGSRNRDTTALGREVISDLKSIQKYLNAYNKTYGEKGRLISNKSWILGMLNQLVGNTDSKALAKELWISEREVTKFAKKLRIKTGRNFEWARRFAVIAALSLIVSGGASVAVEILGINVSTKLNKGPKVQHILGLLAKKGNFNAKYTKLLTSKNTKAGDLEGVFDELNNETLIPANLKRSISKVFGRNFLSFIGDIFGAGRDFRKAEGLIDQFMKTNNVHEWEIILRKLYDISAAELRTQRSKLTRLKKESNNYDDRGGMNIEGQIDSTRDRIKKMESALDGIQKSLSKIVNLWDKHDKITGRKRTSQRASSTAKYEAMAGRGRKLRSISKRNIESNAAYSLALPKPPTQAAMRKRLTLIKGSKVEGDKYSMAAHIMRGINEHHGLSFTQAEFDHAFIRMRKVSSKEQQIIQKGLLSNTGRKLSQSFQWEVKSGNITVMTLNGTNIYFRGECSNILTVSHPLETTIQGRTSIPLAIPVSLTPTTPADVVGTRPIIEDPIVLDDIVVGTVPAL